MNIIDIGRLFILIITLTCSLAALNAQSGNVFSVDSVHITLDDCAVDGSVCLEGIAPSALDSFDWQWNGAPYTGNFLSCSFDTTSLYNYQILFGQGNAGPYRLDSWLVDGSVFTGIFQNIPDLIDSMNLWDPTGNWVDNPSQYNIIGGDSQKQYSQMLVTVLQINTPSFIGYNFSLTPTAAAITVPIGVHQLLATPKHGGISDTLGIVVGCQSQITEHINVEIGQAAFWCPDLTQLLTSTALIANGCPSSSGSFTQSQMDTLSGCVSTIGAAIGLDTFCVVVCDSFGFCHQTTLIIHVLYPGANDAISLYVYPGETIIYCPDTTSLPGQLSTIVNICPGAESPYVMVALDTNAYCIEITGLESGGPVFSCLVLCNDQGACDTQTVQINVLFSTSRVDTIQTLIHFEETYCLDISSFNSSALSITDLCPLSPGAGISYTIDSLALCLTYSAEAVGEENLCLLLSDSLGNRDTLFLSIIAGLPQPDTVLLNLVVNQTKTVCVDSLELAAPVTSFLNACPGNTTGLAVLDLYPDSLCVSITGLAEGKASACLVRCDSFGICDTTVILIDVLPLQPLIKPIAVDDSVTTYLNQAIIIPVLSNDTFSLAGLKVKVSPGTGPYRGTIEVHSDGTITYTPEADYCGPDFFRYELCNNLGCDAATVTISVSCEVPDSIQVFSGFSPNGDGINDYFTIVGLSGLVDNKLMVYNRWGNLVYKKENYQGNWDGTWNGGILPDGTYFYVLSIEGQRERAGYVYLHR